MVSRPGSPAAWRWTFRATCATGAAAVGIRFSPGSSRPGWPTTRARPRRRSSGTASPGRAGYELPAETAPLTNLIVYFTHAAIWRVAYATLVRRSRIEHDLALGAAYWATGWTALQAAGFYRPIRAYPARVVARDLATHLLFGLGAGTALRALRRGAERRR